MTTTLAVYNSEGCVGRCDARCHEAKGPHCNCICGGKNHGAGEAQAIENNHELIGLTREDLERFAKAHDYDPSNLIAIDRYAIKSNAKARRLAKHRLAEPELPLPTPAERDVA
jgi:hypothetical protein